MATVLLHLLSPLQPISRPNLVNTTLLANNVFAAVTLYSGSWIWNMFCGFLFVTFDVFSIFLPTRKYSQVLKTICDLLNSLSEHIWSFLNDDLQQSGSLKGFHCSRQIISTNFHRVPQTYLGHCCVSGHALQERFLVSVAELQVHYFMGKSGELVAEADLVDALHSRGVREAVVLLLLLIVQGVVQRVGNEAVHIIVASWNDLKKKRKCIKDTCGWQDVSMPR